MGKFTAALMVGLLVAGASVKADEITRVLAESGGWVAYSHAPSAIALEDVCVAIDATSKLAFRTGHDGNSIRLINDSWSLPADAAGAMSIVAGDYSEMHPARGVGSTMIESTVSRAQLLALLDAMDKSATMKVTIGKETPVIVSLAGSTRATNAYRTCAGLKGSSALPGANPFR
jgi:hypothetical protein